MKHSGSSKRKILSPKELSKEATILQVNMHEAKTNLSRLLKQMEKTGQSVQICRDGTPVAELTPIRKTKGKITPHPKLKQIVFHESPITPIDPEDWPEEYR